MTFGYACQHPPWIFLLLVNKMSFYGWKLRFVLETDHLIYILKNINLGWHKIKKAACRDTKVLQYCLSDLTNGLYCQVLCHICYSILCICFLSDLVISRAIFYYIWHDPGDDVQQSKILQYEWQNYALFSKGLSNIHRKWHNYSYIV